MTGDTHVLRRLGKDITLSELRYMSEERNMSHREIAEQVGTSYQTILRYLGPKRKKKVPNEPTKKTSDGKVWTTCRSVTRLGGDTHEFLVDVHAGICEMKALTQKPFLTASEVRNLITQLTFIEEMFRKVGK